MSVKQERLWVPYPEEIRETPEGEIELQVFSPEQTQIVMGASGKAHQEVYHDNLGDVPLFKRKGGGGTVLLGPETIVVTVHCGVSQPFANLAYFRAINYSLIDVFGTWAGCDFTHRGISDIAVEDKKVVGTSIFRRKQYLLYQASVLVELDLDKMTDLLRPPPREPDYRKGRSHRDFVTCLRALGINKSKQEMIQDLIRLLPVHLPRRLSAVDGIDFWEL